MLFFPLYFLLQIFIVPDQDPIRIFDVEGNQVKTTLAVDKKFFGYYKGRGQGFMQLNQDGTGSYLYDHYFTNDYCRRDTIDLIWGFVLDENNQPVRFERVYGYSYPVLYQATGEVSFQNCRNEFFLDYILEYTVENYLTIGSSDNWKKAIP